MHFLIIGNGFDIAHGFPTTYTEFLSFCQAYDKTVPIFENKALNKEFGSLIKKNIWIKYFLKLTSDSPAPIGKNWIDFEKELAEIIGVIENRIVEHGGLGMGRYHISKYSGGIRIECFKSSRWSKFEKFLSIFDGFEKRTIECVLFASNVTDETSFLGFLYDQLRKLTRAFEIYCLKVNAREVKNTIVSSERGTQIKAAQQKLAYFTKQARYANENNLENEAEFMQLKREAIDMYEHLMLDVRPKDYLSMGKFDYVLSFNYTNTYERLYGSDLTKYCYINGKAQESKEPMNLANLVLGIDDNLVSGKESQCFCCVNFKKYYQRIILKTSSEYKDWLQSESKQLSAVNYVHIVGHSLDRTDHDVLYEFFSDKRFRIIVYYYDSRDYEEKVQRVIQLLASKGGNGRDELINRARGKNWSIKFIDLYDEDQGLFKKQKPYNAEPKEEVSDEN